MKRTFMLIALVAGIATSRAYLASCLLLSGKPAGAYTVFEQHEPSTQNGEINA